MWWWDSTCANRELTEVTVSDYCVSAGYNSRQPHYADRARGPKATVAIRWLFFHGASRTWLPWPPWYFHPSSDHLPLNFFCNFWQWVLDFRQLGKKVSMLAGSSQRYLILSLLWVSSEFWSGVEWGYCILTYPLIDYLDLSYLKPKLQIHCLPCNVTLLWAPSFLFITVPDVGLGIIFKIIALVMWCGRHGGNILIL